MNMKRIMATMLVALSLSFQTKALEPTKTVLYAQKDTNSLYFDYYAPAKGSRTTMEGRCKPTVMFAFGGGFKSGERNNELYKEWFEKLTKDGYGVVSIDYRLGLKNVNKVGLAQAGQMQDAIEMAVEDIFSAIVYICGHPDETAVDPDNIVMSGSSAGAIASLQAEWEICRHDERASVLPEGFNFTGVMSFSGAIFSNIGKVRFESEPCPIQLFHGTADKIVNYRQLWFFNLRFSGADVLAAELRKEGRNHQIIRFDGRGHEIANSMSYNYDFERSFLEENVTRGKRIIVDALVDNETIPRPSWGYISKNNLYSGD